MANIIRNCCSRHHHCPCCIQLMLIVCVVALVKLSCFIVVVCFFVVSSVLWLITKNSVMGNIIRDCCFRRCHRPLLFLRWMLIVCTVTLVKLSIFTVGCCCCFVIVVVFSEQGGTFAWSLLLVCYVLLFLVYEKYQKF